MALAVESRLDKAALNEFRTTFAGHIILPDDATYEYARGIWNGSIDKHPALIVRCTGVADVVAAVRFAHSTGLQAAIRSGGHSFPGQSLCDGGIVIDLGSMKGIRVDPEERTARAQAGVALGELDREIQAFGMAVPAGIVTTTGLAGLTLGGGIGWLMRKYGLTIDQLLSVDLVTADGEFVKASEDENADLFWGVRGGGGNFGIVTNFEFRLNPVGPTVLAGPIVWPIENAPEVLRFYRDWIEDVPDELTTIIVNRKAPPLPAIPQELHGKRVTIITCCYAGSIDDGEQVVAPLRKFGTPLLDLCAPKPYVAHQSMFDASYPRGLWYYFKACDVDRLSDEVIDVVTDYSGRIQSPMSSMPIFHLGGQVGRVDENATAFSGRKKGHTLNPNGITKDAEGFEEERAWVRGLYEALEPHHSSVYVNFLMDEGEERIRQAYGTEKYERLKKLKKQYDPDNFFRLNQNITPD